MSFILKSETPYGEIGSRIDPSVRREEEEASAMSHAVVQSIARIAVASACGGKAYHRQLVRRIARAKIHSE